MLSFTFIHIEKAEKQQASVIHIEKAEKQQASIGEEMVAFVDTCTLVLIISIFHAIFHYQPCLFHHLTSHFRSVIYSTNSLIQGHAHCSFCGVYATQVMLAYQDSTALQNLRKKGQNTKKITKL